MAITTERLINSSWDNALQIKAPLKWATKQMNFLIENLESVQGSTYWSKLNGITPVQFNTVYFDMQDRTRLDGTTVSTLTNPTTSKLAHIQFFANRMYGVGSRTGEAYNRSYCQFVKNTITDVVALIEFKKISEIKATMTGFHLIEPVMITGVRDSKNQYIFWGNYFSYLSKSTSSPIIPSVTYSTEYDEWVVPLITWYYRNIEDGYPRNRLPKESYSNLQLVPKFVLFGNNLTFWNIGNTDGLIDDTLETGTNDWYLDLTPATMVQTYTDVGNFNPSSVQSYRWLPHYDSQIENDVLPYPTPITPYKAFILCDDNRYNLITKTSTFKYPNINGEKFANLSGGASPAIIAFPDKKSALDYYRDWGIPCTENEDEALNSPISPIPPDIPQDPPVTTIPNYPDDTTDTITINPPSYTASTFGQCKVYTPSTTTPLIQWLGTNTFWQDINRLFANPIDAVFGLRMYNLDIVNHDVSHVIASEITQILNVSTEIKNFSLANGYNTIVEGGTYQYIAYYGNFADFLNASYDIFIPYVGIRRLNPSDVVNRTLHLQYAVDFSTGNATVFLLSDNKLIMTTSCNISAEIPLQTSNLNDVNFRTLMGVLTGAVSGTKTGFLTGSKAGATGGAVGAVVGAAIGGVTSGLDNYLNTIEYGYQGSVSGNNAYAMLEPFLIIRRFPIANVGDYSGLYGLKNASTVTFGSLTSGYIQADTVEIDTRATNRERDEIVALLQNGIHLN